MASDPTWINRSYPNPFILFLSHPSLFRCSQRSVEVRTASLSLGDTEEGVRQTNSTTLAVSAWMTRTRWSLLTTGITASWNGSEMRRVAQCWPVATDKESDLISWISPTDVIFDKETDSLIICEASRVTRWPRRKGTRSGETIIDNIDCWGLTMDDEGSLYVTDWKKHEVRRYRRGETNGIVVAGGNGEGAALNQLNHPYYVCVDGEHAVYVSDWDNHRVMKWVKGAKEGIVVAGGRGEGKDLTQLSSSWTECGSMRQATSTWQTGGMIEWCAGVVESHRALSWWVETGGEKAAIQFNYPRGLSFDRHGHLYVADSGNNRVQRFSLERN